MKAVYLILPLLLLLSCNQERGTVSAETTIENAAAPLPDPNAMGNKAGKEYWPNGKVKAEGNMKDGKRHGLWTGYSEEGRVKSRGEFINGLQQGPTVVFHDNGTVFYSGTYKDGKQVGVWRFYDEEGNELRTVDFDKKAAEAQ